MKILKNIISETRFVSDISKEIGSIIYIEYVGYGKIASFIEKFDRTTYNPSYAWMRNYYAVRTFYAYNCVPLSDEEYNLVLYKEQEIKKAEAIADAKKISDKINYRNKKEEEIRISSIQEIFDNPNILNSLFEDYSSDGEYTLNGKTCIFKFENVTECRDLLISLYIQHNIGMLG